MSKVAAKCIKHVSIASTEDENPLKKTRQNVKPRDKWGSKADFILSMIGYSVGFGKNFHFHFDFQIFQALRKILIAIEINFNYFRQHLAISLFSWKTWWRCFSYSILYHVV